jgi:hypothetical protein
MKRIIGFIAALVLMITLLPLQQAEASAVNKHFTVNVKTLDIRENPSPRAKIVGSLKKGTSVFVYNTEPGGWSKIKYNNKAGYVASSGLKIVKGSDDSSTPPVKSFKNYNGNWFTSADSKPGVGVDLEFTGNNKANIDLFGIWWSMPDGSNARESDAYGYTITFDENGVGKVKFTESRAGNVGIATVKLIGSYVYLNIEYPPYKENESFDSYIIEGDHKLVRKKF